MTNKGFESVIPTVGMKVEAGACGVYTQSQSLTITSVDDNRKTLSMSYDADPGFIYHELLNRPFAEVVSVAGKVIWNHE